MIVIVRIPTLEIIYHQRFIFLFIWVVTKFCSFYYVLGAKINSGELKQDRVKRKTYFVS